MNLKSAMKNASDNTDKAEAAFADEIAKVAAEKQADYSGGKVKVEHPFSDPARVWLNNEIRRLEGKQEDLENTVMAYKAALNNLDAH